MKRKTLLISIFFLTVVLFSGLQHASAATFDITDYSNEGYVSTGWFSGYYKIYVKWTALNSTLVDHYEVWVKQEGFFGIGASESKVATVYTNEYTYHYDGGSKTLWVKVVYKNGVSEGTEHYLSITKGPLQDQVYLQLVNSPSDPLLAGIWDMLSHFFGKLLDAIISIPIALFNWIMSAVTGAINFLSSLITGAVEGLSGAFGIAQPIAATIVGIGIFIAIYLIIKIILYLL